VAAIDKSHRRNAQSLRQTTPAEDSIGLHGHMAPKAQPPRKRSGPKDRLGDDTLESSRAFRNASGSPKGATSPDGFAVTVKEISQVTGQRGRVVRFRPVRALCRLVFSLRDYARFIWKKCRRSGSHAASCAAYRARRAHGRLRWLRYAGAISDWHHRGASAHAEGRGTFRRVAYGASMA
jgi:hypothetical protein